MTVQIQASDDQTISIGKTGKSVSLKLSQLPQASVEHIFAYGLRQILNDARASAKNDAEAVTFTEKRLANLLSGTLRASPVREGDPIKARAMDLALAKVNAAPAFIAWLQSASLKKSDKVAVAKARELAKKAIEVEGNAFVTQAKIDVEGSKGLEIEIEI